MNSTHLKLLLLSNLVPLSTYAWSPGVSDPDAATALAVDITQRNDVAAFYQCIYNATEAPFTWGATMGFIDTCIPGTPSSAYQENVQRRINYYRAMAQLPASISFTSSQNALAQAAALATSANNAINHELSSVDLCDSSDARNGAENGNLALGVIGSEAIDSYIASEISVASTGNQGANDSELARYRRWILHRRIADMGTGDFPESTEAGETHPPAHSLFVQGTLIANESDPSENFATWPPSNIRGSTEQTPQPSEEISFVPANLVSDLWSIQFGDDSDSFQNRLSFVNTSSIRMYIGPDEATVPSTNNPIIIPSENTFGTFGGDAFNKVFGGPALTWLPQWPASTGNVAPMNRVIRVDIQGITNIVGHNNVSFNVVLIDPDVLTDTLTITGATEPETSGANYSFTEASAPGADNYEIRVVRIPVGENAEAVTTITSLGATSNFTLDATIAGAALQTGDILEMSIRATIQGHTFPFGETFTATVSGSTEESLATWIAENYPGIPAADRGFEDDPDGDTFSNGIEYAFGLNPTDPTDAPPAFTITPSGSTLTFDPADRGYPTPDISIRLLTSPNLTSWSELLPAAGTSTYTIPSTTPRIFYQWEVSEIGTGI